MPLQLARSILGAPHDARLDLIFQSAEAMVWTDDGDEVAQFNRIAAHYCGVPPASVDGSGDAVRLTYNNVTVDVPIESDGQDNLRAVLALAALTCDDLAFRLCVDTDGNSEFAFFLLPPHQWAALEQEFGTDDVGDCFLAAAASVDALYAALAGPEVPLSPQEQTVQACGEAVQALASRDASCSVAYDIDDDNYLVLQIETTTDRERDVLFNNPALRSTLAAWEPALRKEGLVLEHVKIEAQETIARDWDGMDLPIFYRVLSPTIWFNRQSDPTDEDRRMARELLRGLHAAQ